MGRILIDLTDLEQWSGQHGGTQRVVYGISKKFFLNRESQTRKIEFISFVDSEKKFRFTSFEPIYNRVENKHGAAVTEPADTGKGMVTKLGKLAAPALRRNQLARRLTGRHAPATAYEFVKFEKGDVVLVLGKPWDNLDIQRELVKQKGEVQFKLVQIVYDLVICLYPHLQNPVLVEPYTDNMVMAARSSDLLLAISRSTADDLRIFCRREKLPEPAIGIIRLGDSSDQAGVKTIKPSYEIDSEFIAYVSTLEIRKNHALLYYSYKLATERNIKLPQLLIIGSPGWLAGDIQYLINQDSAMKRQMVILQDIDDAGLSWVYKNCQFTVYPSMYEGWGLPVAESLAYGKLCIASNSSSIPEIAGDLIDYFSPYSPDECLDKIRLYQNKGALHKKERAIHQRYKATSWQQTYEALLSSINKLT